MCGGQGRQQARAGLDHLRVERLEGGLKDGLGGSRLVELRQGHTALAGETGVVEEGDTRPAALVLLAGVALIASPRPARGLSAPGHMGTARPGRNIGQRP
jgi:hypothetical protein